MRLKRKYLLLLGLGLYLCLQAGGIAWSQVTERVSVDSAGNEGNSASADPSTSSDGRYVAFKSFATNLVAGDTNGDADVFVHDRQTGATTRVSLHTDGTEGNLESNSPSISGDGRYIAFESFADSLVDDDTNPFWDIFVHDRQTGITTRVSLHTDGTEGDGPSFDPSISSDGRYVAFESDADNLVVSDNGFYYDVYVHDRQTGTTTRVSDGLAGIQGNGHSYSPSISADGRYVAFESFAINLVAVDGNGTADVFVHDLQTGTTTRVSVASGGVEGNGGSNSPSISADGRYVAFGSDANNLVGADTNVKSDIFVHHWQTVTTTRVSVDSLGVQGNGDSNNPSISGDGRYVAFESLSTNLVAGDGNGFSDVFVHDRDADGNGTYDEPDAISTVRVSVDLVGVEGNLESNAPSISADGSSVTFQSDADNLVVGDTLGFPDIFVDDLQAAAGGGGGGGSSSGGGGCFISTAADRFGW